MAQDCAGAGIDMARDSAAVAAGRKITCPNLIVRGAKGVVGKRFRPLGTWRDLIAEPRGESLDCGHFILEQRPDQTLRLLGGILGG